LFNVSLDRHLRGPGVYHAGGFRPGGVRFNPEQELHQRGHQKPYRPRGLGFGLLAGGFCHHVWAQRVRGLRNEVLFFEFANLKDGAFFIFQAMFCSTAATIVSGAVAERMKYSSYILSTLLLSAFFYPIIGHWAWGSFFMDFIGLEAALEAMGLVPGTPEANAMAPLIENSKGWLENLGFVDFAGSTVVHSLGGWIALAALIIIGPRRGRFKKDGTIGKINASNVPAAVLGVLILWFGWFGFNGGSTLGWTDAVPGILIRTTIAAAAGMVVTLAVGWPLTKVPDVNFVINGALAGLVAITAPVAVVDTWDCHHHRGCRRFGDALRELAYGKAKDRRRRRGHTGPHGSGGLGYLVGGLFRGHGEAMAGAAGGPGSGDRLHRGLCLLGIPLYSLGFQ
jgi:hypothetical protein